MPNGCMASLCSFYSGLDREFLMDVGPEQVDRRQFDALDDKSGTQD